MALLVFASLTDSGLTYSAGSSATFVSSRFFVFRCDRRETLLTCAGSASRPWRSACRALAGGVLGYQSGLYPLGCSSGGRRSARTAKEVFVGGLTLALERVRAYDRHGLTYRGCVRKRHGADGWSALWVWELGSQAAGGTDPRPGVKSDGWGDTR